MSTDATPSWSGYIFQGEVALCKALEKIYDLNDIDIPDTYCLKLEEDEDFSLATNVWETFQVKAYTIHNYTRYNKAWDDMMRRFPANALRNYLFLHKNDVEIDKFNVTLEQARLSTNVISGVYTLDNIIEKIDAAIAVLFPDFDRPTIELKRNHCLVLLHKAIKRRHKTKTPESFSLINIKQWIIDADIAFNEEIAWYEINKIFFEAITEGLEEYDLENPEDLSVYNKIQSFVFELEQLEFNEIIKLIDYYLTPHKKIDINNLRNSFANYIDQPTIRYVILRAIKEINEIPSFNSLQYYINGQRNQLLIHNNEYDMNDNAEKRLFQKHCETIFNQPNSKDIDCFVTRGLSANLDEIKSRLYPILNSDLEDDYFEFININEFVNKINND